MRIKALEFENLSAGWKLERIEFDKLTLLVGGSGVGKTRILEALRMLQVLAFGYTEDIESIRWDIEFDAFRKSYRWKGETDFQTKTPDSESYLIGKHRFRIVKENLAEGETNLFNRTEGGLTFLGDPMPKVSSEKSLMELLNEEESVLFPSIAFLAEMHTELEAGLFGEQYERDSIEELLRYEFKSRGHYEHYPESAMLKYYVAFHRNLGKPVIEEIKAQYTAIFPFVEDIRVFLDDKDQWALLTLQIKEKDTDWIDESRMSSGMLRTLRFLIQLHLSRPGSVILIDEFENSFGVNCIDAVTEEIMQSDRDLQFILTSHHPYIINNIPQKYWKVVTRKGSLISTHSAEEVGIGKSRHKAFTQLTNSRAYLEGNAI